MSYNKKVWKSGDRITKEALNNMENGIEAAHQNSGGTGSTAIVDNLNSDSPTSALSAKQGKALNNKIPTKSIVEGGKIYLAKEDGTKLDSGTELPVGGSTIEVVNNLESDSTTAALSAAQGKALNTQYKDIAKKIENGNLGTSIEPQDDDIPKVFLSGENFSQMTTSKNEVKMDMEYISKTDKFKSAIKIKYQGSSTLAFPKHNYTIKMYTDNTYTIKLKKEFRGWGYSKNKYVLKANWVDHTHARNVVTARLWGDMVNDRTDYESLPDGLKSSPNNGAVDGFPIKVYVNGKYEGLYTWNIGKDDWMFGMDATNVNQAVLCAERNNNGNTSTTDNNILTCEFRANANIDGNDWSLEFPDILQDNIKTSFNNLINCIKDTDDVTFKSTIETYLDITSALDYYILMYLSADVDGLAKNLIMMTYDGTKWFCSAYDMDNIWGSKGTSPFASAELKCPSEYYDNNNLLWKRLETCFVQELKSRYVELRKSSLSITNIINRFERFTDCISSALYAEDIEIYSAIPYPNDNNLKQIRNYVLNRSKYVDNCINNLTIPIPCTNITLNKNTLTFTDTTPQTLTATLTPADTTDTIIWSANLAGIVNISNGIVTPKKNGTCVITATCGNQSATCNVNVSGITEQPSDIDGLSNVISYFKADTLSQGDTTWNDSKADSTNVVTLNGATISEGKVSFDGVDDYATSSLDLSSHTALTLALNVYNLTPINDTNMIVAIGEMNGGFNSTCIKYDKNKQTYMTAVLPQTYATYTTYDKLILTRNGNEFKLYVNGNLMTTGTITPTISNYKLRLGANVYNNSLCDYANFSTSKVIVLGECAEGDTITTINNLL